MKLLLKVNAMDLVMRRLMIEMVMVLLTTKNFYVECEYDSEVFLLTNREK